MQEPLPAANDSLPMLVGTLETAETFGKGQGVEFTSTKVQVHKKRGRPPKQKIKMQESLPAANDSLPMVVGTLETPGTFGKGQGIEFTSTKVQVHKKGRRQPRQKIKMQEPLDAANNVLPMVVETPAFFGKREEVEFRSTVVQLPKKRGRPPKQKIKMQEPLPAANDSLPMVVETLETSGTFEKEKGVEFTCTEVRVHKKRGRQPKQKIKMQEPLPAANNLLPMEEGTLETPETFGKGQGVEFTSTEVQVHKKRGRQTKQKIKMQEPLPAANNLLPMAEETLETPGTFGKEQGVEFTSTEVQVHKKRGRQPRQKKTLTAANDSLPVFSVPEIENISTINKPENKRGRKSRAPNKKRIGVLAMPSDPSFIDQGPGQQSEKKKRGKKANPLNRNPPEKHKVIEPKFVGHTITARQRRKRQVVCFSNVKKEAAKDHFDGGPVRLTKKALSKCGLSEGTTEQNAVDNMIVQEMSEQAQVLRGSSDSGEPEEKRARRTRCKTWTAVVSCKMSEKGKRLVGDRDFGDDTFKQGVENSSNAMEHMKKRGRKPGALNAKKQKDLKETIDHLVKENESTSSHPGVVKTILNTVLTTEHIQDTMSECDSISRSEDNQICEKPKNQNVTKTCTLKTCHFQGLLNPVVKLQSCQHLTRGQSSAQMVSEAESVTSVNTTNVKPLVSLGAVRNDTKISVLTNKSLGISVHQQKLNKKKSLISIKMDFKNTFGEHDCSVFLGSWRSPAYIKSEDEYSDDDSLYTGQSQVMVNSSCQRVEPFSGKTIWKCSCARTSIWTFPHKRRNKSNNRKTEEGDQSAHWWRENAKDTVIEKSKLALLLDSLPPLQFNHLVPCSEGFVSRSCSELKHGASSGTFENSVETKKDHENHDLSKRASTMFSIPKQNRTEISIKPPTFQFSSNGVENELKCNSLSLNTEKSDLLYNIPPVVDNFGKILSAETCFPPICWPIPTIMSDSKLDTKHLTVDTRNEAYNYCEVGTSDGCFSNFSPISPSKDDTLQYADPSDPDLELEPPPEKKCALIGPVCDEMNNDTNDAAFDAISDIKPDENKCFTLDAENGAETDVLNDTLSDAIRSIPPDTLNKCPIETIKNGADAPIDASFDLLTAYENDVLVIDVIPDDPDLFGSKIEESNSWMDLGFCKRHASYLKPKTIQLVRKCPLETPSTEHDRTDSLISSESTAEENYSLFGQEPDALESNSNCTLPEPPERYDHLTELEEDTSELPDQSCPELIFQTENSCMESSMEFGYRSPSNICLQTESALNENQPHLIHVIQDFVRKDYTGPDVMNPESSENCRHQSKLQFRLPFGYCKYFFNSPYGCLKAQCLYLHIPKQGDEKLCMDLLRKLLDGSSLSCLQRAYLVFSTYYSKYPPRVDYDEQVFNTLLHQLLKMNWCQEVLNLLETVSFSKIRLSVENLIEVFQYIASSGHQVAVPRIMGIFSKCLAGITLTLPEIDHIIAKINQLPNPALPINFLLSVKSRMESELSKKNLMHNFEAALGEIEHYKVNCDWVKLGALYVHVCTGCENVTELNTFAQCIAEALMKESVDDRIDVPYCEFADSVFIHPHINEIHKTLVGRIGISVMFFYSRKELWQKGRRMLFKFRERKINYKVLNGITGKDVFASPCAVVNVAVEIWLMCGRLNSAVQTLKDCDWILHSDVWPCDKMDVLKRHSLLCNLVQEALNKSMYTMCFEILQNLPGFKESQAEFSVSQYNLLFNKVLNTTVSNQSLSISSLIVDFMVRKDVPIDYNNLHELIAAYGHSSLWKKARDLYKCVSSLGFYPPSHLHRNNTILYIPSFMSSVEMLLTIEGFMVSNSSLIRLPDEHSQILQIILRKKFREEDNCKSGDNYRAASERLAEAGRLSSPRLFIKHLTVNNSGEQVYTLDLNCCVKWLNENMNWAMNIWGFH